MPRADKTQLNIRSAYARNRARELASRTGITTAEVVEDALRGHVPAASGPARPTGSSGAAPSSSSQRKRSTSPSM